MRHFGHSRGWGGTTYGNEMCGLTLFQFDPQPIKVLVPAADRVLRQIELSPGGLMVRERQDERSEEFSAQASKK